VLKMLSAMNIEQGFQLEKNVENKKNPVENLH
jgi:hypothetical protein